MVILSNGYKFYYLLISVSEEVSEPYLTSISFIYRLYYLLISVSEEVSEPNLRSISFIYRNLFKEPLGELGILSVLDIILVTVKKARESIEG